MGQSNSYGMGQNCSLQLVQQFPIGKVVKEQQSGNMHFLKQYSYNSQQSFQHAFIKFSRKLTQKHENILNLEKTNTKVENTFCSTFYKIVLVFQYIDHTLKDQIQMRNKQNRKFQQKQIWSILFHCTLAIAHLRRTESFQHSAIRPEDIRLSSQGLIKIIPTEMVGISGQHDQNQATTKILAMTIISCIMMKHISNHSNQFLEAVIQKLQCSNELKQLLKIMVCQNESFEKVEEYLFRLAQQDGDSVLSGVSTPAIRSHQKPTKDSRKLIQNFDNIQIDIKMKGNEHNCILNLDSVDLNDKLMEFQTFQQQNPDENDHQFESNQSQNQMVPLTQKQVLQKFNIINQKQKNLKIESQIERNHNYKNQNYPNQSANLKLENTQKVNYQIGKLSRKQEKGCDKQNIFTDPKLLDWIKKDFQQLKSSNLSIIPTKNQEEKIEKQEKKLIQLQTNSQKNKIKCEVNNNSKGLNLGQKSNNLKPQEKKQLKITKQQQCFGNILDEQASFKKSKTNKKYFKQGQIQICTKKLNNQTGNASESQTLRVNNKTNNLNQRKNQQTQRSNHSITNPQKNSIKKQTNFQKIQQHSVGNLSSKNQISAINKPKFDKNNPQISKLEYVTETYQKGKYQGQKLNQLRHGHGTFLYNEGGRYVGQWKQNKMDGKGILYYPNNSIAYQGNWKNDQLHGYGILFNEEVEELHGPFDYRDWTDVQDYWVKYEGMFKFDNKQGNGKLYLSNGQIFEGIFLQDMVNGQGVLSRRDGSRVKGYWRNNKLIRMF